MAGKANRMEQNLITDYLERACRSLELRLMIYVRVNSGKGETKARKRKGRNESWEQIHQESIIAILRHLRVVLTFWPHAS